MPWNYDDEEINGIVDANLKDSPPNPPGVNTASSIRNMLKSFWSAIRGQVETAVDGVDLSLGDTILSMDARITLAEQKADDVFETFSLADGIGTFDASTGIAKITETGVTYTLVDLANQANGKYFQAISDGIVDIFSGDPILVKIGGTIISRGTKWDYLPPADTGYAKSISRDLQIDELFEISTGILKRNLSIPAPYETFNQLGVSPAAVGWNWAQLDFLNREFSITGPADAANEGYTAFFNTQFSGVLNYDKITLQCKVNAFTTPNPCVGIGFDYSGGKLAFLYRKDGSLVRITPNTTANIRAATGGLAYIATDVIKVEIVNTEGALTIVSYKNGVAAAPVAIADVPTGPVRIAFRGSINITNASVTTTKESLFLSGSKDYVDGEIAPILEELETFDEKVTNISTTFIGKAVPVTGVDSGATRIRIDLIAVVPVMSGAIKVSSLKCMVGVAGVGRIKMYSRSSDLVFVEQLSLEHTFVLGENTLPGSLFDAWTLQPGWYIGFEATGTMQFSNVVGAANSSMLINAGVTSYSSYEMQYRLDLKASVELKEHLNILANNLTAVSASIYYVSDSAGNDSNAGTEIAPFKTIAKAISKAIGKPLTKIVIGAGDYYETLNYSTITYETIHFLAKNKAVVRIMGSTKFDPASWVKTEGKTNIYEIAYAGAIPAWNHPPGVLPNIFEDKNPSKLIAADEVDPLQRGLTHRLPYTTIQQIAAGADLEATLVALDAAPGRHYLSGGKLYIHASGSTNPTSNGFVYHIPVRNANAVPNAAAQGAKGAIVLEKIQFYFSTGGFISAGVSSVTRFMCNFMGSVDILGGWRDDSATVVSYRDEAGGNANDGFNQHYDGQNSDYAGQDVRAGTAIQVYFDPWTHDNGDDGMSCHVRGKVSVWGGLAEWNGDGGFVPANGGNMTNYGSRTRRNGFQSDATQAGFGTANSSVGTGNNQTTQTCFNCISENDRVGFQNNSESGSIMALHNCVAREATDVNYKVTTSGAIINANNSKSTHSNAAKHKSVAAGGILNIRTDQNLV